MITAAWVAEDVQDDGAAEFVEIVRAADRVVVLAAGNN